MSKHRMMTVITSCYLALLAAGCRQPPPDTRAADEAAIRQADIAWSKVAEAKQVDAMVAYYAGDAVVLAQNAPMATTKEAVGKMMSDMFAMPGFGLKWQATKVEAARSGDFGYSLGTYEMTLNDPKGKPMTDRGKYATVWKKQPDGTWKTVVDMFNSDLPPRSSPAK
jgi:ketosteroid isomerase-like protein